ncbi:MAG: GAF domain-containing protein [Chloroflexi bacterium]|nr:GAF domain-containing protein [Chloroflexota bacterium]
METRLQILYLDDEPNDARQVRETLASAGVDCDVLRVETREQFGAAVAQGGFDLILSDIALSSFDGLSALALARQDRPNVPFIFVSGALGEEVAIESLKNGATDYVLKEKLARLAPITRRALREAADQRERTQAEDALRRSHNLLNLTGQMAEVGGWEVDLDTQTLSWTDEVYRVHEVDPATRPSVAEAINFYAPEARPVITAALQAAMDSGTPWDLELPLITATGRPIWVRAQGAAERRAGRVVRLHGVFQDITKRRRAEESLRQRLAELEALHTISAALRVAQTRDEALPILLDETLAALETDAGAIWLYYGDSDELRPAVERGWFQQWGQTPMKPGEGIAGTVLASGHVHHSAEFRSDPLACAMTRAQAPAGWSGACLPIRTDMTTVGVLYVSVPPMRHIAPQQLKLLESLAEMGGAALHRMRLHEETVHHLEQLQALHSIDRVITASMDLRMTLSVLLEHVQTQLRVDATAVLLLNPHSKTLEYASGRGFRTHYAQAVHVRVGEDFAGRAVVERRMVHVTDAATTPADLHLAAMWQREGLAAYFGVPLIAKGQVKGVLEVFHRTPLTPDPLWLDFLETLAGQAAIAIDNAQLFENLQRSNLNLSRAYDATIEGWSRALDLRDKETEGHTQRVTTLTLRLARSMGLSDGALVHVQRGALLHDIGKMGVPDSILLKPGPLSESEWALMRRHPVYAHEMLAPIDYLQPALDIPYCHHEKWDGTGYPRGIRGDQIPMPARIFAVADVWDALRSDRPYRRAWPEAKVLAHIRAQTGQHFDPRVVEAFLAEHGTL